MRSAAENQRRAQALTLEDIPMLQQVLDKASKKIALSMLSYFNDLFKLTTTKQQYGLTSNIKQIQQSLAALNNLLKLRIQSDYNPTGPNCVSAPNDKIQSPTALYVMELSQQNFLLNLPATLTINPLYPLERISHIFTVIQSWLGRMNQRYGFILGESSHSARSRQRHTQGSPMRQSDGSLETVPQLTQDMLQHTIYTSPIQTQPNGESRQLQHSVPHQTNNPAQASALRPEHRPAQIFRF